MDGLWATKSEVVGLIVRAISFQDFQPMWSSSTNATDRQIPRYAPVHRGVKTLNFSCSHNQCGSTESLIWK